MCLAQMVVHFHWCNCLIEKGCQNIETKWLMQEGTPKERLTAVTYKLTRTVHLVIVSLSCLALGMVHFRAFVTFPLRAIKKKRLSEFDPGPSKKKCHREGTPFPFPVCCCCCVCDGGEEGRGGALKPVNFCE